MEFNINFDYAVKIVEQRYGNTARLIATDSLTPLIAPAFFQGTLDDVNNFKDVPSIELIEYLRKTHQLYLQKLLPEIGSHIERLANECPNQKTAVRVASILFHDFQQELTTHIEEEESSFLPLAEQIFSKNENSGISIYDVAVFCDHHDDHEASLLPLINLIQQKFPKSIIASVLLTKLRYLLTDLTLHHQLEEQVLLPRLIEKLK